MGNGLIVCGLNGCGKSTLGKALAQELGFYFIDNEYLFFDRANANDPYANPRSHEEAEQIFAREITEHEEFVFAAVTGNYGKDAHALYRYAILIETPKEIRIQRVKNRSFQKFGNRMLPSDTESVEAYAHKKNKKSQGILEHMGLKQIGESKNGNSYHYQGNYTSLIKKFS